MSSWDKEWAMTFSGTRVFPFELKEHEVHITDIAHALAMQCRYNGHVNKFYSVAEHCLHISASVLRDTGNVEWSLCGLLHDAGEAYTGDFTRPVKNSMREVGEVLHEAEDRNELVIARRFQLEHPFPPIIKDYDRRIIVDEKEQLFGADKPWDWDLVPLDIIVRNFDPVYGEHLYLEQFTKLMRARR
jgi:hypothetical protein